MLNKLQLIIALTVISVSLFGEDFTGRVTRVLDGDTIDIMDAKNVTHRIRLYGVDAPEKCQEYGAVASLYLAIVLNNKSVEIISTARDRYGRLIGQVRCSGKDINAELVRNGLAWHYVRYAPQDVNLKGLEATAKSGAIGLWSSPNPIPPWQFRKSRKKKL